MNIKYMLLLLLGIAPGLLQAQQGMQFFRPNDMRGINMFEPTKADTVPFNNMKVRVGGNFTQDFQSLKHENNALPLMVEGVNTNKLMPITSGFTLAMANLNIDAQLEDGIRMSLTMYLSARHHEEAWVKGGYVQIDKLAFLKSDAIDEAVK